MSKYELGILKIEQWKSILIQYQNDNKNFSYKYGNILSDRRNKFNIVLDDQEHLIYADSIEEIFSETNPNREIIYEAYNNNMIIDILIPRAQ